MFPIFLFIILVYNAKLALGFVDKEITVVVEPGREDCYFATAKKGEIIDLEFQVIDGGHGDLDITFHLVDPNGRILFSDYKKSENSHRAELEVEGDYKMCFDNTFSSYNSKTVFLELIIESPDGNENKWGDEDVLNFENDDEDHQVTFSDVEARVNSIRNSLIKIEHYQALFKSVESKDRNIIEEVFFFTNAYSMLQLLVMLLVGGVQVLMIKSLFDDKSKLHQIMKSVNAQLTG